MTGKRVVKFNGNSLVAAVMKGEREPSVTTVRAVKFQKENFEESVVKWW